MRRKSSPANLEHLHTGYTGDGRLLEKGDIVRVVTDSGGVRTGWFRFLYSHDNGDLTLWGPCNKHGTTLQQAQFISVHPDQIGKRA